MFATCCCSGKAGNAVSNMDAIDENKLVSEMSDKGPAAVDIREERKSTQAQPEPIPPLRPEPVEAKASEKEYVPEKVANQASSGGGKKPETFSVQIVRSPEEPVGLDIDVIDDISAVVVDIRAGAVQSWNEAHPERLIKSYDRILEVNDERGDSNQLIMKLKKDTTWELTVQRPIETSVSVTLASNVSLGLNLKYAPSGTSLMIVSVDEGPMREWNSQNPGREVKKHDRIIEVNGTRGASEQLVRAAHQQPSKKAMVLDMVILQYSAGE